MIITYLIYGLTALFNLIIGLLPKWQVWPASVTNGLSYFVSSFASLNFLFPVDTIFSAIIFFIGFTSLLLIVKLIFRLFKF